MKQEIRETYESLIACLTELNQIRLSDFLQREPLGKSVRFRKELPYLQRTLEIFHRLSRRHLTTLPLDVLRNINATASATLDQFRGIITLADEDSQNFDEALRSLIVEIKNSFDRVSANFAMWEGWEQPSNSVNSTLAIGVCMLVVALALMAYFSSHAKAVADALLRAMHGIRLS